MGLQNYRLLPQYKPMSENDVLSLAEKFTNIKKAEFLCQNTLKIVTVLNTYYCDITYKYLVLKHQVNLKKQHTRLQGVYTDFQILFLSIQRHDTNMLKKIGFR